MDLGVGGPLALPGGLGGGRAPEDQDGTGGSLRSVQWQLAAVELRKIRITANRLKEAWRAIPG